MHHVQYTRTPREPELANESLLAGNLAEEIADKLNRHTGINTVAIAQISTDPGCIGKNLEKILATIAKAKAAGANLLVFPELTIPGYAHMDLAFNKLFLEDQLKALDRVRAECDGITVVVGFINQDTSLSASGGRPFLYNSLAVIKDQEILHTQDKSHIPNYGVHFEARYFQEGNGKRVIDIDGIKVGFTICEDIWGGYASDPAEELKEQGAQFVINTSASPFAMGKLSRRAEILKEVAQFVGAPVLYANLVGAFDSFDSEVVFDGRSMIVGRDGAMRAVSSGFEEELLLYDIHSTQSIELPVGAEINELHDALVLGIKEYFRRNGFQRAYVGLSGGIDSAVVAALAVEALGAKNVIGVTMPSHITSSETKGDALELSQNLHVLCHERAIGEEYRAWLGGFREAHNREPESITKQNKQARIRGSILMEYTNEDRGGLVITTGNKTELALGYCTLYGDMCGGFAAISDVDKLKVYELAKFINRYKGREVIPRGTIERAPSAELEEGQEDRDNLPADYDILAPLVNEIIEDNASREELLKRYPESVVDKTLRTIDVQEYKRRQAAPGIRVTERAFGIERRMPMGQGYRKSEL